MLPIRFRRVAGATWRRVIVRQVAVLSLGVLIANALPLGGVVDVRPFDNRVGLQSAPATSWLPGQHTIDANDGYTAEALGRAAARSWAHGQVPYWNSNEGLGTPLAGELQSGAFSPFVLLLLLRDGLLYLHVLLELIAGIATLLFLDRLKIHPLAATTCGLLFALNGTHAWLTNAAFAPIAFLPVVLLGVERAREKTHQRQRGGSGLIAVGLALSLLAGFPEVAFFDGLLVGLWSIIRIADAGRGSRLTLTRKIGSGIVLGVMMAAPILVAFLAFLGHADIGRHASGLSETTLGSGHLFTLLLPYATGTVEESQRAGIWGGIGGYLGTSAVVLALYGLFDRRFLRAKLALAAFALAVALRIYGAVHLLTPLWNLVPGVSHTAFNRYSAPALEFAVILLAAHGLDGICRGARSRRRLAATGLAFSGLFALSLHQAWGAVAVVADLQHRYLMAAASAIGAAVVGFGILLCAAVSKRGSWTRIVAAGLVACECIVLFALPQLSAPRTVTIDRAPIVFLRDHLGTGRFFTVGPIAPNYGSYLGLAELNVNDLPTPSLWSRYATSLNGNTDPQVFTGFSPSDPAGPSALQEFSVNIHAYEHAGVRYLLTYRDQLDAKVAAQLSLSRTFRSPTTDIYRLPSASPYFQARNCALSYGDRSRVTASCSQPSTLTRLELDMPGWSAEVNGHAAAVSRSDGVFQSVALPAGHATVTFAFQPPSIVLAWTAAALAVLILAVGRVARSPVGSSAGRAVRRGRRSMYPPASSAPV